MSLWKSEPLSLREPVEVRDVAHVQTIVLLFRCLPTGQGKEHLEHLTGGRGTPLDA